MIVNQLITAAVSVNPKKGPDWLLGNFLFGTEFGEGQLKKPPCMSTFVANNISCVLLGNVILYCLFPRANIVSRKKIRSPCVHNHVCLIWPWPDSKLASYLITNLKSQ